MATPHWRRAINLMAVAFSLLIIVSPNLLQQRDGQLAEAIKCYTCQSNIDPKCADPFDNLTLPITDCDAYPRADLVPRNELDLIEEKGFFSAFSQPAPVKPLVASMCRKVRQKVDGEWRTIRGCGYLGAGAGDGGLAQDNFDSSGHCKMRFGSYDVFMESCTCSNKDGCNAAHGSQVTTLARGLGNTSALFLLILSIFIQLALV